MANPDMQTNARGDTSKFVAAGCSLMAVFVGEIVGYLIAEIFGLDMDLLTTGGGAVAGITMMLVLGGKDYFKFDLDGVVEAFKFMWWIVLISLVLMVWDFYDYAASGSSVASGWFFACLSSFVLCLAIGFSEECEFRGLLTGGVLARFGGTRRGLLIATAIGALFFGSAHISWGELDFGDVYSVIQALLKIVQTGMYAVMLTAVMLKTKSMLGIALVHAFDDYVLFASAGVFGDSLDVEYVTTGNVDEALTTIYFYLVICALYLPTFIKALRYVLKTAEVPNFGPFVDPEKLAQKRARALGMGVPSDAAGYAGEQAAAGYGYAGGQAAPGYVNGQAAAAPYAYGAQQGYAPQPTAPQGQQWYAQARPPMPQWSTYAANPGQAPYQQATYAQQQVAYPQASGSGAYPHYGAQVPGAQAPQAPYSQPGSPYAQAPYSQQVAPSAQVPYAQQGSPYAQPQARPLTQGVTGPQAQYAQQAPATFGAAPYVAPSYQQQPLPVQQMPYQAQSMPTQQVPYQASVSEPTLPRVQTAYPQPIQTPSVGQTSVQPPTQMAAQAPTQTPTQPSTLQGGITLSPAQAYAPTVTAGVHEAPAALAQDEAAADVEGQEHAITTTFHPVNGETLPLDGSENRDNAPAEGAMLDSTNEGA